MTVIVLQFYDSGTNIPFLVVADLCENVQCKFGARCEKGFCVCPTECPISRDPVCGSDFLTYSNECELQKAACRMGHSLNVHFYGECSEGLVPHRAPSATPTQPPPLSSPGEWKIGHFIPIV